MATSEPAQSSSNREHLFQLQILIIDGGGFVLSNIVDQKLEQEGITLNKFSNETPDHLKKSFQYDRLVKAKDTSELDITLSCFLLINFKCFKLGNEDKERIKLLRDIRNELSHIPTTSSIGTKRFETLRNKIEEVLVELAKLATIPNIQETIDCLKSHPFENMEFERIQKEMKKWEDFEAEVDRLNKQMRELETQVKVNTKEIAGLKVTTAGVPHIKTEEEKYEELKKELQGDLIKFYRRTCSSIPLSPLLEEIETPLAGFYVMPDLVAVKQKSLTCHEEERTPIKGLGDLFSTKSEDQKEIYLLADAGFGKTAFSKYLAITWCQAHRPDKKYDVNKCFKDNELNALSKFEFLFLVFLRDHTSVSHIDDMIRQQFSLHLPSLKSLDEISFGAKLNEVLSKEKGLIILDGLDEWAHPNYSCNEVTEEIPNRCIRDNCVILTTARPWKFGVANLKTIQIDKKVELVQLSEDSTRQLEYNAIKKMTGVHDDGKLQIKIQDLNTAIRERGLEYMQVIPLLLMYIVNLWCYNIPLGNSKHELYTNVIEFLLSRTSKKHPKVKPSRESSASEIPDYLKSHEFCKQFYSFITSLAELAYQTLFNETRENMLAFDRRVAELYLKADDMELSLLSGILSERRSKTLFKRIITVAFAHKTVQEFFAAIFLSSLSYAKEIVVEKCRNVQDILDMSKVYEFISGMNADLMCTISEELMYVINEDAKTRDFSLYFENLPDNPLYNIQKMFMSCLQEMPESENIQLCLQDFFIGDNNKNSEPLQRLLKQNKTNIQSLYIDISSTSSNLREIIDLFSLTDLSHIQKLYYYGDVEKEAEISRILFPSLQVVTLEHGTWTNEEENLSENLSRVQNLQYLYIECFTFSYKILDTFFNFISGRKTVKELKLAGLDCNELGGPDCKRLNLDLSQHSTISELDLREFPRIQLNISTPSLVNVTLRKISLDERSVLLSLNMLNIKRVELERIEMSAGSLHNFIYVLEHLPQSVTIVMMEDIKPYTEYDRVRENIRRSQTFHVIQDNWGRFKFKTIKSSKEKKQEKNVVQ